MRVQARTTRRWIIGGASLSVPALAGVLLFSGWLAPDEEETGYSAQAVGLGPRLSLDMVVTGNMFNDALGELLGSSVDPWVVETGNECANATSDDGDGAALVNDGCPRVGGAAGATGNPDPETGVQCANAVDDDVADDDSDPADPSPGDGLGLVNDGCPVGGTEVMSVGGIQNCFSSAIAREHTHVADLVIIEVEDLVGWQARINFDGLRIRVTAANNKPFHGGVSFVNLPIVNGSRAQVVEGVSQFNSTTVLIGAAYVHGDGQSFPRSSDSPLKLIPDGGFYDAPAGGVLSRITYTVQGAQNGHPSLHLDLDDGSPNTPGSQAVVFTGDGTRTVEILEAMLGDGFHGEGVSCEPLLLPTPEPLLTPPPEAEGGFVTVPPGWTPPVEVTPPPPTHITIKGQEVPLAPGMRYWRSSPQVDPAPPSPLEERWIVTYDSDVNTPGDSWITFDLEYNLTGSHIRPEDQEEFQPLLDALAAP